MKNTQMNCDDCIICTNDCSQDHIKFYPLNPPPPIGVKVFLPEGKDDNKDCTPE